MLIKTYDDKDPEIQTLFQLLEATSNPEKRKVIAREIKKLQFTQNSDKASLDELSVHFGEAERYHLIQDFWLNIDGKLAHIDHLLINRYLDIHVLDTKHFSEGLSVSEDEEFMAWYGGKSHSIPSPLERNEQSIAVLIEAMRFIHLPTRFGIAIKPAYYSAALVSNRATLLQPELADSNTFKTDQFASLLIKEADAAGVFSALSLLPRMLSLDALARFTHQLVAMHRPQQTNWRTKLALAA